MKGLLAVRGLAVIGGAPPAAFAQAVATIQISGVVQDSSGAVVPGAVITATQTDIGLTRSVSSGADGDYVMTQLPIGPYQIRAEKTGFKTYVQKGLSFRWVRIPRSMSLSSLVRSGKAWKLPRIR